MICKKEIQLYSLRAFITPLLVNMKLAQKSMASIFLSLSWCRTGKSFSIRWKGFKNLDKINLCVFSMWRFSPTDGILSSPQRFFLFLEACDLSKQENNPYFILNYQCRNKKNESYWRSQFENWIFVIGYFTLMICCSEVSRLTNHAANPG